MTPFPHRYQARASGSGRGSVLVSSAGVAPIDTQAPPEFGGPGGQWSPETLLVAAIADCFILSFRAVARARGLQWDRLTVDAQGTLDRAGSITRFVRFRVSPRLSLCDPGDADKAHAVLEKAHRSCLVTASLAGPCELEPQIILPEPGAVT